MATPRSYGTRRTETPKGMLAPIYFPELMKLDVRTHDGRLFDSGGFSLDEEMMPFPVKVRTETAPGHDNARLSGLLEYVEVASDGVVSGWGWAANTEAGKEMALAVGTQMCRTNSVDLRDCRLKVKLPSFEEMFNEDEAGYMELPTPLLNFPESKLAGTTIVAMPAFATSRAEMDIDALPDELFASFAEEFLSETVGMEMTASGGATAAYDEFFVPEPDHECKVIVDGMGRVYGHLGTYDRPHTSMSGKVYIPRSRTNYAKFNKPGVLTEKGLVSTGPIFLLGGHPKAGTVTPETINKAYGDIDNTWADVRVMDGKIGPWISGRVRPGTSDEKIYAARASRLSGHWLDGELYAIVSCNAEGFDVEADPDAVVEVHEGRHLALVASFSMGGQDDAAEMDAATVALASIILDDLGD